MNSSMKSFGKPQGLGIRSQHGKDTSAVACMNGFSSVFAQVWPREEKVGCPHKTVWKEAALERKRRRRRNLQIPLPLFLGSFGLLKRGGPAVISWLYSPREKGGEGGPLFLRRRTGFSCVEVWSEVRSRLLTLQHSKLRHWRNVRNMWESRMRPSRVWRSLPETAKPFTAAIK